MIRLLFFVIIFVIALWVPLYNKVNPTLFGFPFFYWFQMLVVIASSVMILSLIHISEPTRPY